MKLIFEITTITRYRIRVQTNDTIFEADLVLDKKIFERIEIVLNFF